MKAALSILCVCFGQTLFMLLLLFSRGHWGVLDSGRAGRGGSREDEREERATANWRACPSQAGPPASSLQTFTTRDTLRAAARLLQPDCWGAEKRTATQVGRKMNMYTQCLWNVNICLSWNKYDLITYAHMNKVCPYRFFFLTGFCFLKNTFFFQEWDRWQKLHAEDKSHEGKGWAKGAKEVQLRSPESTVTWREYTTRYASPLLQTDPSTKL